MPSKPDPVALLNAWLALEALQPQTFPEQADLISDEPPRRKRGEPRKTPPRLLLPFDISSGQMPWDSPAGDRVGLKLSDEETIRWYLPVAFAKVKPAVELLVRNVEPDGPEREQASGVAVLALASFDERGFPSSKVLLSSFGWACGEVLAGRISGLHRYLDVQDELCREIGDALVERAEDGCHIPTSKRGFVLAMSALERRLNLPKEVLERPKVAIRVIGDSEKEPVDIINSFFLRDLHRIRTAVQAGGCGPMLETYLGNRPPPHRCDVLADKALLEDLLAPRRLPLARWPAPKPAKLVTLQQAAVNAAMRDLADGGMLSVNGPPGTGKTTLLRDVIAAVILDRADALLGFEDPGSAFSPVDLVAEGGRQQTLYRLDARLRGRGIVVASSNNAAVRNVSAELPLAGTVAPDVAARHFPGTADAVHGKEGSCWGLIAAVLGNMANRTEFVEDAWWHPDWGLEKYLAAVTGRVKRDRAGDPPPAIVEVEAPPRNKAAAMERWRQACLDYREKRAAVASMRALREQIRMALWTAASVQQAMDDAHAAHRAAAEDAEKARETRRAAELALVRLDAAVADARRLLDGNTALQPIPVFRWLGLDARWRQRQEEAMDLLRRMLADQEAARTELSAAGTRMETADARARAAEATLAASRERWAQLRDLEARCPEVCAGTHLGPSFWSGSHEAIHTASPWADPDFTAARDEMFAAAMRLHRAFIDAAGGPMKSNLGLMMSHLKGKRTPSGADAYLGDLWDSFFLVVPLVSTTFASFDRLMDGVGEGGIGWLIVDEAGQATPQAAVGAVWRSRRALIIGDPLQIEPVSKVPTGLVRSICASYGAHPDLWAAPRASAQTLADAVSPLMARLGAGADVREIGLPLLVHRRCQDPMFSISNEIAYGGLMVHAAGDPASPIADALSPWVAGSAWIDVRSNAEKWSKAEGEAVVDLLRKLSVRGIRKPSLYIISPFRAVADKLRAFVLKSGVLDELGIEGKKPQEHWAKMHIGTVHTFQGKEAEAVLLVLGASADTSRGSRNWAGGTPNILNVAATRAKKVIYVVGCHAAWVNTGVFAVAAAELPVVRWPFDAHEPSGEGDELPIELEDVADEEEGALSLAE
ncbi:DEAD/DEAH box helicase [Azospirillum rugosum]|uniref:DNA2/NAM7 helicase-like C-terminal domain-containing protein n=1 Tax=Azospirillum rugosum TaxID=416170 RepID=A0ABS4SKZ5_9PROT|nr:ATP-binding protein [Azospirillum rugosum]MBP2293237.1 hypothetical protein [Azospirillum rugosum]